MKINFKIIIFINLAIMLFYFIVGCSFFKDKEYYNGVVISMPFILNLIVSLKVLSDIKNEKYIMFYFILLIFNGIFCLIVTMLFLFLAYPILIALTGVYLKQIKRDKQIDRIKKIEKLFNNGIISESDKESLIQLSSKKGVRK